MAAEYIDILRTELERQRQFLSEEEEQVLLKPASYESEDDLALDSVKRRQHTFVPILRDRFVRDGRPLEQWWDVLAEEERLPEDRTMIGAMVVQVLDWSARTSDQKAMMGGFGSKLLLVAAVLIGFFGDLHAGGRGVAGRVSCCWSSRRPSGSARGCSAS